jgi:hypothetical protein
MTIFDHIDAHLQQPEDERVASELIQKAEQLFKTASTGPRLNAEQEWYTNERYIEGDHWLRFDRKSGTIVHPKNKKRVMRSVNLVKQQMRAIKNFVLKQRFTWETAPVRDDEASAQEAKVYNHTLSTYVYDILDVPVKLRDVFSNALPKYYGAWQLIWDDDLDDLRLDPLDSFDVYPDPNVRDPRDGLFVFKTSKTTVAVVKENQKYYPWRQEVSADDREAASDFKDSLEKRRASREKGEGSDETSTVIVKELFLKRMDSGEPQIYQVAYADQKLLAVKLLERLTRFPILFYFPERNTQRAYGTAWLTDLRPINRAFENVFSLIEDYFLKIKPKLMRPKGSNLKPISDELGEILEYSGTIPDQLKEFVPAGLSGSIFQFLDVCRDLIETIGGAHAASVGKVPTGVKSGRGIEALKAGDENNVGDPKDMLERFLEETAEVILELIANHQVTEKPLSHFDGKTTVEKTIMGANGLMEEGSEARDGVTVISPRRVRVTIAPAIAYTEEGRRQTALDLYDAKLIDRQTALETFRFSNVGDIVERVERERAAEKALEVAARERGQAPPIPPEAVA